MEFNKDKLLDLLHQLSDELAYKGYRGRIIILGGASMCLVHGTRDTTQDIDALYDPKTVINDLVHKIAEREDISSDWLNDSVKGFVNDKITYEMYLSLPNLDIYTVSKEYLLAMKLKSVRYGTKDEVDIKFLLNALNIASEDDLFELIFKFFDQNEFLPKTWYIIHNLFNNIDNEND